MSESYLVLISPFNGGELRLPLDTHPDLIEALIVAGFHRPLPPPPVPRAFATLVKS
jgi:hypothetical protein